jgi:excisionase family DNA binding protein
MDPEEKSKLALSVPEVATVLGLHPNTVWALIRRGELASVRAGRRVLIPLVALEAFLKAGH